MLGAEKFKHSGADDGLRARKNREDRKKTKGKALIKQMGLPDNTEVDRLSQPPQEPGGVDHPGIQIKKLERRIKTLERNYASIIDLLGSVNDRPIGKVVRKAKPLKDRTRLGSDQVTKDDSNPKSDGDLTSMQNEVRVDPHADDKRSACGAGVSVSESSSLSRESPEGVNGDLVHHKEKGKLAGIVHAKGNGFGADLGRGISAGGKDLGNGDSQSAKGAQKDICTASQPPPKLKKSVRRYILDNSGVKADAKVFKRVKVDDIDPQKVISNAYEHKPARQGDYGLRAHKDLVMTKGKNFRCEKNKKKKGRYSGGRIDTSIHSVKFNNSDDEG